MLRSVAMIGRRAAYTCTCLVLRKGEPATHIWAHRLLIPASQSSPLHTSQSFWTPGKDNQIDKDNETHLLHEENYEEMVDAPGFEEEFDWGSDKVIMEDGAFLNGVVEHGDMVVPSLKTHSALVNGVPYNELPIVHVQATLNNTIIVVTDHTGADKICKSSCGMEGFKHVKKSTNLAAQATGLSVGKKALKRNVKTVRVALKGIGAGRLAAMTGLKMAGLEIISITDVTPTVFSNGPKPRKAKRK